MRGDGLCPVCKLPIDKEENAQRIRDEGMDTLWMVSDMDLPEEALTEQVQVLYHNGVHADCFYELE